MTFPENSMLLSGVTLLLLSFPTQSKGYDKMRTQLRSSRPQRPWMSQSLLWALVFLSILGSSWIR